MILTEEIRYCEYSYHQHDVAKVSGPFGQVKFWSWNFSEQVLQETKGTGPATKKAADKGSNHNEQADGDKWEYMQGTEVGQDSYRAGKSSKRTGVAMKNRRTHAVQAQSKGIEPKQ